MHTTDLMNELNSAIGADYAAKDEAVKRRLAASRPFTTARLAELCALGEKMKFAKSRKDKAYGAARAWLHYERLDLVLPEMPAGLRIRL